MRSVSRAALAAAIVASVVAPVVAVSYMHTSEGLKYRDDPGIATWVDPSTDLLEPLFDRVGVERTYLLGTQLMSVLWVITILAAITVARRRRLEGRTRTWWSATLAGYVWLGVGLIAFGVIAGILSPTHTASYVPYFAGVVPGLLLSLIGSCVLGVGLLRRRDPARAAAWLLALSLPLWVFANLFIHNSIGLLPMMWAWAMAVRQP